MSTDKEFNDMPKSQNVPQFKDRALVYNYRSGAAAHAAHGAASSRHAGSDLTRG